jgi:hypothetical protein
MKRSLVVALSCCALAGCGDAKKKTEEKQAALEKLKVQRAALEEAKAAPAVPKAEPVRLEPFWDDPSYLKIASDAECPEGLWALFDDAPGLTKDEKKASAAKKPELAKKLRDATFVVRLKPPDNIKLLEYDAPKGEFPIEAAGGVECSDSFGHVTIAWNPAKAIVPGMSAAKAGAEVAQNIWVTDPMAFRHPVRSQSDAKEFKEKHRFDVEARVIVKLGKVQVDKKMFKTAKQTSGAITIGGGTEDWGAGRMVKAELLGVRVATDREKNAIIEKKNK